MKLLFIIGSSRSGSKMIRDMLNNIDSVCITSVEMKIMPDLLQDYIDVDDISVYILKEIYDRLESSTYALTMHNHGKHYDFYDFKSDNDKKRIIEILKNYICHYEGKSSDKVEVFGDKTPSYHKSLKILDRINNKSDIRIINMIRDPRDVALSFRNSWGKSLYRSAYKWNKAVNNVLSYTKDGGEIEIKTIRFEDVLNNAKMVTDQILNHLELSVPEKLSLWEYESSEVFGAASGYKGIKKDNTKKFESELNDKQIKSIEELCYLNMNKFSYPILHSDQPNKANNVLLGLLYLYDNVMYVRHILFKERGIKQGSKFLAKTYKRYFSEKSI